MRVIFSEVSAYDTRRCAMMDSLPKKRRPEAPDGLEISTEKIKQAAKMKQTVNDSIRFRDNKK
jgi:hypothetical protein